MLPEHCPNPECPHFTDPPAKKWYSRIGFHKTKAFGDVQRYRCHYCGRTFSDQTFSIDFYAKKTVDYKRILLSLCSASGNRDMAREMMLRDSTIQNRIERLARWCQAIHSLILKELPFTESFAADGLESFSQSQYFPNNINIIVGRNSQFIYNTGLCVLRRKGRMTDKQKERREELEVLGKASPKDTKRSMEVIIGYIVKCLEDREIYDAEIWTDLHKVYPQVIAAAEIFRHFQISSKEARTYLNALFAVNYIDRQIRKDLSDHARETVQFARHPAGMMSRLVIYRFFHNCLKPFRIKDQKETHPEKNVSHSEMAGLKRGRLAEILKAAEGKRFFLGRLEMDSEDKKTWLQEWTNPGQEKKAHVPRYLAA